MTGVVCSVRFWYLEYGLLSFGWLHPFLCGCGARLIEPGFDSQGNDFSFYMLLPAYFILNRLTKREPRTIYPFVHFTSSLYDQNDMLNSVTIPDVEPTIEGNEGQISFTGGDFLEVYNDQQGITHCLP